MKTTLRLYRNTLQPEIEELYSDDKNILNLIIAAFPDGLPKNFRLYKDEISLDNEIFLNTKEDLEYIAELNGDFWGCVDPEGGGALVYGLVILLVTVASAIFLKPKIPNIALRNTQAESGNNSLTNRTNQARPLERIPDIFGTVRSIPDLLSVPLTIFIDHIQYEFTYMCIGRGWYQIPENQIKEGSTPCNQIYGESIEIYSPFTSPNNSEPQLRIGQSIDEPIYNVVRNNNVNGEDVEMVEGGTLFSLSRRKGWDWDMVNTTGNGKGIGVRVNTDSTSQKWFKERFNAGDKCRLESFYFSDDGYSFNLDGTYTITHKTLEMSGNEIFHCWLYFENPESVTTDWNYPVNPTGWTGNNQWTTISLIQDTGDVDSGWYYLDDRSINTICCNYTAEQGLYKDDGTTQYAINVALRTEYQQVDFEGNPFGEIYVSLPVVVGSETTKKRRACTLMQALPFTGRCRVRTVRISPTESFVGTVVDTIQWRDLYGLSPVTQDDFGNVTTIYAKTKATQTALAVEERKLNMLVTRMVTAYTSDLVASNNAADIIYHICKDPYIGNRPDSEIDAEQIYAEVDSITEYFGTTDASDFCYTFDKTNITFEETVQTVANAVFSTAYRRGSKIKLNFEREQENSVLLFNHRNKIPNTETRHVKFGIENDYDGIEYQWVNPEDDSITTYYIKNSVADEFPLNPQKIESIGVRNYRQAYWHAWRAWNKLKYSHTTVEFDALAQSELVLEGDKVLIANNLSTNVQDGDIIGQSGLILTTSQPVVFESGETYYVFLQLPDGTVQSIECSATSENNELLLTSAPITPIIYSDVFRYRTKYMLVKSTNLNTHAFLITERATKENNTSTITAINYDSRFYENDPNPLSNIVGWGYNWGNYWGGTYA